MPKLKSCGFIITRGDPVADFLLMVHKKRLDFPKGHVDGEETDTECALRELNEETGIQRADIEIDPDFRFSTTYEVRPKKFDYEACEKTTTIFHARLVNEVEIQVTEHQGFQWRKWRPPHHIQAETIDPLLAHLAEHLENKT